MGLFDKIRLKKAAAAIAAQPDPANTETAKAIATLKQAGGASVPYVMEGLNDANASETFAQLLRQIVDNLSLPLVTEGLKSPSPRIVTGVIKALSVPGRFDPNKLIELYLDPKIPSAALIKILTAHGGRVSMASLLKMLETAPKEKRQGVFRLIEQVAQEANAKQLLPLLSSDDPFFRIQIIKVLSQFQTTEVRDAFMGLLHDPNRPVRQAALEAIGTLKVPVDVVPLINCLRDPDLNVQSKAIDTVIKINHPDSVTHLIDILQDESEYVRRAAVEVLNVVGNAGAIKNLIEALRDRDWWVRTRAADALGMIGGPRVVDAVLELVRDKDEYIRRFAIEILNTTKDDRAFQYLLNALEDKDWWVRERAVDALATLKNKAAVPQLVKMLDRDEKAAPVVLRALTALEDPASLPAIAKCLDRANPAIRKEALRAMGALAGREHVDLMRGALAKANKDPNASLKQAATDVVRTVVARLGEDTRIALQAITSTEPEVDTDATMVSARSGYHAAPISAPPAPVSSPSPAVVQYVDVTNLKPGDLLADRYTVVRHIGRGAFGEVVLVDDRVVSEPVILKFLRPDLTSDEDVLKRFVHELRYARRITHKNVIRIFDFIRIGSTHAMSMEYFDSLSLSQLLKQGRIDQGRAFRLMLDVCRGMVAAHQVEVVHRDLKPANVLVNDKDQVKIVDFGLAAVSGAADSRLTKTGVIVGTPTYMAPEQVRGEEVTARTDIYSLGVILYEIFTGRPPYQGQDPMSILFQHLEGKAVPPSRVSKAVGPDLEKLIQKAMAVDPAKRFSSIAELGAALESLASKGAS